jgi:hypothetical protein
MPNEQLANSNNASANAHNPTGIRAWWRSKRRPVKWLLRVLGFIVLLIGLWQGKEIIEGKWQSSKRNARESRRIRVLVPLYATKKEFFGFVDMEEGKHLKLKKESFTKKVSRDMMTAVEGASQKWFSLRRGNSGGLSDKQVDFYFFPEGYAEDPKSFQTALAKALREANADGYDAAGVLGNITSTATVEYGKICGQKNLDITKDNEKSEQQNDVGQLPMVLPLSTASNVPQTLRGSDVPAVLRFPPDNEEQSKVLADFLLRQAKQPVLRTVVIRDVSNRTYSNDLIDNFRDRYVESPLKEAQEITAKIPKLKQGKLTDLITWGNMLAVLPAGGESGDPAIFAILEKLTPDAVLVCGMTDVSLETLAQVNSSQAKPKYVLLTDGAVDEYLLPQIANLVSANSDPQVFLSFPLETANPSSVEEVLKSNTTEKDRQNLEMTHALYVIDSVYIILTLLDEGIFKNEYNDTSREILTREMKSLYENGPKDVGIKVPSGITYTFDAFGNSTNLKYRLFRMCFPEVADCPKDKGIVWVPADSVVGSTTTK